MLIPNVVTDPAADLTGGIGNRTLLRGALDKQLIVLAAVVGVLAQEDGEDRVIAENIRVRFLLLVHYLDGPIHF